MPGRSAFWVFGVIAGTAAALCVPEALFPAARPVVMGALVLTAGLLGEFLCYRGWRPGPGRSRDTRLPDGRVEIVAVSGVETVPNREDPRFGRFVSLRAVPLTNPRNASPARPMTGRVCLVSLFVGHDGRPWSDVEIAESHLSLERAGRWLEREAERWGAGVNVDLAGVYFVDDQTEGDEADIGFFWEGDGSSLVPMDAEAERKALLSVTHLAKRYGFNDAQQLFRTTEGRVDADTVVWLLHPRRAGHSLAVCRDASPLDGVTLAVCYAREANFAEPLPGRPWTDPATVVHEVLHLFGATDKYGRSLREYDGLSVTSREVMRLSETRLSRLRVDPQTAFEIGWTDTVRNSTDPG